MEAHVLTVQKVSKDFGGVTALNDVSFSVAKGERLAIIGPNGAGKTSLLNVINGQYAATAGRINFMGHEITKMSIHRRTFLGMARTFQLTSLFLNLSVLHNMLIALHGVHSSRFEMFRSVTSYPALLAKAQQLLNAMDIWERRNFLVMNLSYGEQRKLEIAIGLASGPKMLLLDEPGNGLTAQEASGLADQICNFSQEVTVIVVAHDMDLVFRIASRIIVLHYGQIISQGTPDEIQADPNVREIYMGEDNGPNA